MWFRIFTIGLLAFAVFSLAATANDGRIPNIIDPCDEHPWGGDNYTGGNPIVPISYAPVTPDYVPLPQGVFIRLAVYNYWIQLTHTVRSTTPGSGSTGTTTRPGGTTAQPPSRPSNVSYGGGN